MRVNGAVGQRVVANGRNRRLNGEKAEVRGSRLEVRRGAQVPLKCDFEAWGNRAEVS